MPVVVIGSESDDDAAAIARIVDQHAENTHRAGLTAAEHTSVVGTLFDLGLTADQVTKRTRIPRAQIDAARAISASKTATRAALRNDWMTLDHVAAIAEFDRDKEAVKAITAAAKAGDGQFAHALQQARDERADQAEHDELVTRLEAAGVTIIGERLSYANAVYNFTDDGKTPITSKAHQKCPGHVVFIDRGWEAGRHAWISRCFCTDPKRYGHKTFDAVNRSRPEADAEKAREERRRVIANNRAWKSATKVRMAWLEQLARWQKPDAGALRFILWSVAMADYSMKSSSGTSFAYNRIGLELLRAEGVDALQTMLESASDLRAQVITLVLILAAYEDDLALTTWRQQHPKSRRYLMALASWGYVLSDVERIAAEIEAET